MSATRQRGFSPVQYNHTPYDQWFYSLCPVINGQFLRGNGGLTSEGVGHGLVHVSAVTIRRVTLYRMPSLVNTVARRILVFFRRSK